MSKLVEELRYLRDNISRTEGYMDDLVREHWSGICCPSCGVPGYSDLVLKQERRRKRIAEIQTKLTKLGIDEKSYPDNRPGLTSKLTRRINKWLTKKLW